MPDKYSFTLDQIKLLYVHAYKAGFVDSAHFGAYDPEFALKTWLKANTSSFQLENEQNSTDLGDDIASNESTLGFLP
jgi:hypothetical protein